MTKQPKYEYYLVTWGGFYNDEHKSKHGLEEGNFWFDTAGERQSFIDARRKIEEELNATVLMIDEKEGYSTREKTTLHRVCRFKGKEAYTEYYLGYCNSISVVQFMFEYKWYPGFNDYPFGEDFDYEAQDFEIVQEWSTGALINE
jgi:hypothetical protein